MTRKDLAWRIAGFVERFDFDQLTADRQARVALCYLDFLALSAAASSLPEARHAAALSEPGPVTIPGVVKGVSESSAILALGYQGALLQLHDGYGRGGNHPSSALVPVAHVMGRDHDLRARLGALALGYEVANRLSESTHPAQSMRGSAPTATMGAMGAAAIAAKLAGLDRQGIAEAVSVAAILAPLAPYEALRVHGSAVPFHGAMAGRAGVEACRLAALGLAGGDTVLEGRPKAAGMLDFLKGSEAKVLPPEDWQGQTLDFVYFKSVPGCRHVQPALDALARIQPDVQHLDDISEISVGTYPLALAFAIPPAADYALYDRLMSLNWAIAASALYGGMSVAVAGAPPDARSLDAMIAKIKITEDPAMTALYPARLGARVTVTLRDGRVIEAVSDLLYGEEPAFEALTPAGGFAAPLSRADLIARDAAFLAPVWAGAEADLVRQTIEIATGL